jgi:hypothetical protein
MKVRTEVQLFDLIDGELIWRKKELTQFKFLLESAGNREDRRVALLRSAVTLLYAHWESFFKTTGLVYLEYVASQRLRFEELAPSFLALAARKLLGAATGAKRIHAHVEVTRFFRGGLSQTSSLPYRDGISTRANLSSEVLREIIETLGLDFAPYETKGHLIDEGLLYSRNTIAHGEYPGCHATAVRGDQPRGAWNDGSLSDASSKRDCTSRVQGSLTSCDSHAGA